MSEKITKKIVQEFFPKATVKEEKDAFKIHSDKFDLGVLTEFYYTVTSIKSGSLKRSGTGITLTIKK